MAVRVQQNVSVMSAERMNRFENENNMTEIVTFIVTNIVTYFVTNIVTNIVTNHIPIFDLQQIADQTICRTALHEIILCGLECFTIRITVLIDKILAQTFIRMLANLMQ